MVFAIMDTQRKATKSIPGAMGDRLGVCRQWSTKAAVIATKTNVETQHKYDEDEHRSGGAEIERQVRASQHDVGIVGPNGQEYR